MVALIKKEFRESFKIFFPIVILSIVLISFFYIDIMKYDSVTVLSDASASSLILTNLIAQATLILIISLIILGIVSAIRYLYVNIYNDKGYELFTLPVTSTQIIVSKVFVVCVWLAILVLLYTGFSVFYEGIIGTDPSLSNIKKKLGYLFSLDDNFVYFRAYFNYVLFALGGISSILFAGALANSKYIQKGRPLVAFITVLVLAIVIISWDINLHDYGWYHNDTYIMEFVISFGYLPTFKSLTGIMLFRATVTTLLLFGTGYLWNKKLQF